MRLSLLESGHQLIRTEKQGLQAEIDWLKEENRKLSDMAGSHQTYLQGMMEVFERAMFTKAIKLQTITDYRIDGKKNLFIKCRGT